MAERQDYLTFKKNVYKYGDRWDRIENATVYGMPDVNLCIEGVESWVEQKHAKEPLRATTPLFGSNHKVSQKQMNWFLRQKRAGGRCYFLVATNRRWLLLNGEHADNLNKMTVDEMFVNSLWHAVRPVRNKTRWEALRLALIQ